MSDVPLDREKRIKRNLLNLGAFALEVLLILLVGPWALRFFMPMLIGWILAQMANPLVRFLEKHLHIVRRHSSVAIILGAILLIVLGCYYLFAWLWRECGDFIASLPEYYQILMQGMSHIAENLQGVSTRLPQEMREQIEGVAEYISSNLGNIVSGLGSSTVEVAGNVAGKIPALLVSFLFVVLFAYFFIAQRERVHQIADSLIPKGTKEQLQMVWDRLKYAVGGYFRAQFKIMGVVFVLLVIGFLILRIDYALLLAFLIAFLDFLPMLGTGTALIPWALFFALNGNLPRAAGLLILYAVTQATRQLIQPKMVGDSIGVDTLTTLVFLFIGYRVSGILGMIVAIPVGLILIQCYEAGAFDRVIRSGKELAEDIHALRFGEDREEE